MKQFIKLLVILVRIVLILFLTGFLFLMSRIDTEDELRLIQSFDVIGGVFVAATAVRIYEAVFGNRNGRLGWKSRAVFLVSWILFSGSMAVFHERAARARWYVPPRVFAMNTLLIAANAVQDYLRDCGDFPLPDSSLSILMMNPGVEAWSGPYIDREEMKDPWGTWIRCDVEPERVLVRSAGPDLIFETADDLTRELKD